MTPRTRGWLMWAAWTVLTLSVAMWFGLKLGRPVYYSDGVAPVAASELVDAGMLRWLAPEARFELPGRIAGRIARLPDGTLLYAVLTDDGTSDLVTWNPQRPGVPPEPAYGLNSGDNEVAPAVGNDGQVWFASDRLGGAGGYDLYVSNWTGRGFGSVQAVAPCNTALDETDPAPDAGGERLVFVRIDRVATGGDDGVLWHWRLGDALDPVRVFPELDRRQAASIDRDPAFDDEAIALWFVRRQGARLDVCRATRLGDQFAAPIVVSREWSRADLRSPLPLSGGRELGLLQAGVDGPSLWFVARAREVLPWWPGQRWLEWLLLSLALCAGLLLLLLYLGQRWQALDLVAQCLLLSLLLHVLLWLWLMGVEIAGSLMPGDADDGSGMQVHIVTEATGQPAEGVATGGDVAARVAYTPLPMQEQVAAPGSGVARGALRSDSLQVANGSYTAELAADAAHADAAPDTEALLADAPAAIDPRRGDDAEATVHAAALPPVDTARLNGAPPMAASRLANAAGEMREQVVVTVPASAAIARAIGGLAMDAPSGVRAVAQPIPSRSAPPSPVSAVALQDVSKLSAPSGLAAAQPAREPAASTAIVARTLPEVQAAFGSGALPRAMRAALDAPSGTDAQRLEVAAPASAAASTGSPAGTLRAPAVAVAAAAGRRNERAATARQIAVPMPLLGDGLPAIVVGRPSPAAGVGLVEAVTAKALRPVAALPSPTGPSAAAVSALRSTQGVTGSVPLDARSVPRSSIDRSDLVVAAGSPLQRASAAPQSSRRVGVAMALREPNGLASADATPSRRSRPVPDTETAQTANAAAFALPNTPRTAALATPSRPTRRHGSAGFERLQASVTAPGSQLPRAVAAVIGPAMASAPSAPATAYSNRFGPQKAAALQRFGGTADTERAVRDGLSYLARIQNANGSWGDNRDYDTKYGFVYVGKTALCVLAFLGAGHTPASQSQHSAVVQRALQHLLSLQDEQTGAFGRSSCYGHGICTYALAECYGLTKDPALVQPLENALTWILANQGPRRDRKNRGGWGYFSPGLRPEDDYARISVTSWMVMALESARLSGVDLPGEVLPAAREYLEQSCDSDNGWFRYNQEPKRLRSGWPTLPASTPAAGFCLMLLGMAPEHEMVQVAVDFTVERRPRGYRRYGDDAFVLEGQGNVYFWYYGSLCCFLRGGEAWDRWNERLRTVLPAAQAEDGSFPPIDVYAEEAGDNSRDRSYTTAMCVLSLEVYYRYFTPLLLGR